MNRFGYKDGALRKLNSVKAGERGYSKIGISKSRNKVVTGNDAGNINVWHLPSLSSELKLNSHELTVKKALVYDESDYLITSSYDETIKIWGVKKFPGAYKMTEKVPQKRPLSFKGPQKYFLGWSFFKF